MIDFIEMFLSGASTLVVKVLTFPLLIILLIGEMAAGIIKWIRKLPSTPWGRYRNGYSAANAAIEKDGGTAEVVKRYLDVACEDPFPDLFTTGWIRACREYKPKAE